ncbi:MAG: amidohydrolase [Pseudomonadales bacterium]|jgi:predicted amidohydrolase YtcJ|nr:amidohydrolase [Pseudomonadales bacterium]
MKILLSVICLLLLTSCSKEVPSERLVDLVLTNGKIYTVEGQSKWVEAVAIKDGRYVAMGDSKEMEAFGRAETIDLQGRMAMPGINDVHVHPLWGGVKVLYECSFPFTAAPKQIKTTLSGCAAARPDAVWIRGGQWGSDFFTDYKIDSPREFLDEVSTTQAIYLADDSGHNAWVNTKALELAGIDGNTPDPEGGIIKRDSLGRPTGVLIETAGRLYDAIIPPPTDDENVAAAKKSVEILNAFGITGMKDAGAFRNAPKAYNTLDRNGGLSMHVAICLRTAYGKREGALDFASLESERDQYVSTNVHTNFVKLFLDGVPTSARTAAMLKPYVADEVHGEGFTGELHLAPNRLREDVIELDRRGFTIKMHAAGDRSVRVGLDAIQAAREINGNSGLRHELAHAGYIDPSDIPRFGRLNVAADFSPYLWHPSPIIESVVSAVGGKRAKQYWATRDLIDSGGSVSIGSDWPAAVPDANPWSGLAALVTRADPYGSTPGTLWLEQAVTLQEAISIFTLSSAVGLKLEGQTGSVSKGKFADLIVLDRNLFEIPPDDIAGTQVELTFFKGQLVYEHTEDQISQ